jgi:LPS export ABC transporter protein LptC
VIRTRTPSPHGRSLSLVAVLLTALWFATAGGCGKSGTGDPDDERRDSVAVDAGAPVPEQIFYDYRLRESEAAVPQWILQSQEMRKYTGREDLELITVKMDFYDEGEYFSTLTSDSGTADTRTNDVFVWGDVVVVTADGRRLYTEELYYDSRSGLVHNDVFNRLEEGDDVITGIGLEATPDLDYIQIKQQVEAEVGDESLQEEE